MSKRLQVIVGDAEYEELRRIARAEGTTVSEWVRRSLQSARRATGSGDLDVKLAVLRAATQHSYPTAEVEEMLSDIERGYLA